MKLFLQAGTLLLFCASFFIEVNACTCLDYGVPIKVYGYEQGKEPKFFFINSYILDWGNGKDGREVKMVEVSRDGTISLSLFEGNSYIVVVETDAWGDKVKCGMAKVDISSQPSDPLRIVIDKKGRCDEKAFAKMLDAGIKK